MFMLMVGLMIGLLGATFSAGVGQIALSYKGENYLFQLIICLCLFMFSIMILLVCAKNIFTNNTDFTCMILVSLIPICMIANIGREKGLSLRKNE